MTLLLQQKIKIFQKFLTEKDLKDLKKLSNTTLLQPSISGYNAKNCLLNKQDYESNIIKRILAKIYEIDKTLLLDKGSSTFILFPKNSGIKKHVDCCLRFLMVISKAENGGIIKFNDEEIALNEKDCLFFDGGTKHEVTTVESDKGLFVLALSFERK